MSSRSYSENEGTFEEWEVSTSLRGLAKACPNSTAPTWWDWWVKKCDNPKIRYRRWHSNDGAYTDLQLECCGCGHVWWIDGDDG